MVLNGQLRALQLPPQTPKMSFCSPGAPKLCTEPTPFPLPPYPPETAVIASTPRAQAKDCL
ncbi:hypothetical protein A6R68_01725, partial [Neotoma lepida]